MMLKRIFTLVLAAFLIFGCVKKTSGLRPEDVDTISVIFLSRHIKYHEFNDEISERTLNNILYKIDPSKYYFYKSDINEFMKKKDMIDDYVKSRDISFIFQIFEIYKQRVAEIHNMINDIIKKDFDFNLDENIILDSDKLDYTNSKEEIRERWRKNIKLQLLFHLTSGKDIDEAKKNVKKKYELQKKRIDEIDKEKIIAMFLDSFSTGLDPHSNYLTQEEHEDFQISNNLKLEGIGVMLGSDLEFTIVERIIPGGPASKLVPDFQLKPKDKIIAVAQGEGEPVDVVGMDQRDVVKLIRGKKGTVVKLTILRDADEKNKQARLIIPIIRDEITLDDNAVQSELFPMKMNGKEIKIGYIRIPSFYMDFEGVNMNSPNARRVSGDLKVEIEKLKALNIGGMVLDLRGNPGGMLSEAVDVAGMFIDKGPVVQVLMDRNNVDVMKDKIPGVDYDGLIVLLIDKFSASASEIFAGAIKDYKRGIIIGSSSTFGKGSVQTYNVLPGNNGAIKITTALFYQPGGSSNQLNGIEPDITVPDTSVVWDIGEDKLKYPLNWEIIEKASFSEYTKYLNPELINTLKKSSDERIKNDKKFSELIKKIDDQKVKNREKSMSLKKEAENENKEKDDLRKNDQNRFDEKLIDLDKDLFLKEAFNITNDYIQLMNN